VAGEDLLSRLRVEIGKIARRRAQQNVALLDLRETEIVQDFGDREQVVDLELQGAREFRQVRLAVVRRCGDGLVRPAMTLVEIGGSRLPSCNFGNCPAVPTVGRAVICA